MVILTQTICLLNQITAFSRDTGPVQVRSSGPFKLEVQLRYVYYQVIKLRLLWRRESVVFILEDLLRNEQKGRDDKLKNTCIKLVLYPVWAFRMMNNAGGLSNHP